MKLVETGDPTRPQLVTESDAEARALREVWERPRQLWLLRRHGHQRVLVTVGLPPRHPGWDVLRALATATGQHLPDGLMAAGFGGFGIAAARMALGVSWATWLGLGLVLWLAAAGLGYYYNRTGRRPDGKTKRWMRLLYWGSALAVALLAVVLVLASALYVIVILGAVAVRVLP